MADDPSVLMKCPECGVSARGKESYLGKRMKCPKCHGVVQFSRAAPVEKGAASKKPDPPVGMVSGKKPDSPEGMASEKAEEAPVSEPAAAQSSGAGDEEIDVPLKIALLFSALGLVALGLAPFFTWINLGKGGLIGTTGVGMVVLGLTGLAIAAFISALVIPRWRMKTLMGIQAWGTVAFLWMGSLIWKIGAVVNSPEMGGSPLGFLMATQITPGVGLYLGLVGGVVVAASLGFAVVRDSMPRGRPTTYLATQAAACAAGILLAFLAVPDGLPERDGAGTDFGSGPVTGLARPEAPVFTVESSDEPDTSAPPVEEEVARLAVGSSTVIDEVQVTVKGVRRDNLEMSRGYGDSTYRTDEKYLIVDVELLNTSEGKIVHLQQVWDRTTVVDDFENIEGAKFSDGLMMRSIVGAIRTMRLKPGDTQGDMIIFPLPVDAAKSFRVQSDPRFWKAVGDDRINELSDTTFEIEFSKSQIKEP